MTSFIGLAVVPVLVSRFQAVEDLRRRLDPPGGGVGQAARDAGIVRREPLLALLALAQHLAFRVVATLLDEARDIALKLGPQIDIARHDDLLTVDHYYGRPGSHRQPSLAAASSALYQRTSLP